MANRTSGKRAIAAERREKAWELRKHGYSFRKIAETLAPRYSGNYSKSQAQRDVQSVLDDLNERTLNEASEARSLDLARLDDLLSAWFRLAKWQDGQHGPDRQAADVVLKVLEQRAKLYGLYRQELALSTNGPLVMAVGDIGDLSELSEQELDGIIRNLEAALGAG